MSSGVVEVVFKTAVLCPAVRAAVLEDTLVHLLFMRGHIPCPYSQLCGAVEQAREAVANGTTRRLSPAMRRAGKLLASIHAAIDSLKALAHSPVRVDAVVFAFGPSLLAPRALYIVHMQHRAKWHTQETEDRILGNVRRKVLRTMLAEQVGSEGQSASGKGRLSNLNLLALAVGPAEDTPSNPDPSHFAAKPGMVLGGKKGLGNNTRGKPVHVRELTLASDLAEAQPVEEEQGGERVWFQAKTSIKGMRIGTLQA